MVVVVVVVGLELRGAVIVEILEARNIVARQLGIAVIGEGDTCQADQNSHGARVAAIAGTIKRHDRANAPLVFCNKDKRVGVFPTKNGGFVN